MKGLTQPQPLTLIGILRDKPVSIRSKIQMNFSDAKAEIVHIITQYGLQLAQYLHPTPEQVLFSADMILSDYGQLSAEDVELCLRNGIKGLYGEIMRFDTSVICGWLTKYVEEKRQAAMNYKADIPKKQTGKGEPMPPEVKQGLIELFQKHGIKEPFSREDDKPKRKPYVWPEPDPNSKFYKLTIDALEYFKELWNQQGNKTMTENSNTPWIMYGQPAHGYSPDSFLTMCYALQNEMDENETQQTT